MMQLSNWCEKSNMIWNVRQTLFWFKIYLKGRGRIHWGQPGDGESIWMTLDIWIILGFKCRGFSGFSVDFILFLLCVLLLDDPIHSYGSIAIYTDKFQSYTYSPKLPKFQPKYLLRTFPSANHKDTFSWACCCCC